MALHIRRGDRGRRVALPQTNNTLGAIRALVAAGVSMAWRIVSDSLQAATSYRSWLSQMGVHVIDDMPRPCVGGGDKDAAGAPPPDPIFQKTLYEFGLLQGAAGVVSDVPNWGTWIESSFSTVAALSGSSPILYPFNSSDRYVVCRRCRSEAAREPKRLSPIEAEHVHNGGRPMRGLFFLDSLDAFVRVVASGVATDRAVAASVRVVS